MYKDFLNQPYKAPQSTNNKIINEIRTLNQNTYQLNAPTRLVTEPSSSKYETYLNKDNRSPLPKRASHRTSSATQTQIKEKLVELHAKADLVLLRSRSRDRSGSPKRLATEVETKSLYIVPQAKETYKASSQISHIRSSSVPKNISFTERSSEPSRASDEAYLKYLKKEIESKSPSSNKADKTPKSSLKSSPTSSRSPKKKVSWSPDKDLAKAQDLPGPFEVAYNEVMKSMPNNTEAKKSTPWKFEPEKQQVGMNKALLTVYPVKAPEENYLRSNFVAQPNFSYLKNFYDNEKLNHILGRIGAVHAMKSGEM